MTDAVNYGIHISIVIVSTVTVLITLVMELTIVCF